jgi:hypothetical protein
MYYFLVRLKNDMLVFGLSMTQFSEVNKFRPVSIGVRLLNVLFSGEVKTEYDTI